MKRKTAQTANEWEDWQPRHKHVSRREKFPLGLMLFPSREQVTVPFPKSHGLIFLFQLQQFFTSRELSYIKQIFKICIWTKDILPTNYSFAKASTKRCLKLSLLGGSTLWIFSGQVFFPSCQSSIMSPSPSSKKSIFRKKLKCKSKYTYSLSFH